MKLKHACVDAGQYGLNVSPEEYVAHGVRLIRTSDVTPSGLADPADGVFLPGPIEPRFVVQANDVLLSRSGTIGRSFLVPAEAAGSTFAGFLVRFRAGEGCDPRYLNYALQSWPVQEAIKSDAITSTIQNFNADRYANLTIPDQDARSQRRIADFLDDRVARIDRIIAARRDQISRVEEAFESRRRDAVLGLGKANRHVTNLPWAQEVGDGWRTRRLGQLAQIGTGHTPSRSKPEYWEQCSVPWLTTADVHRFRKDEVDVVSETVIQISDLGLANSAAVVHPARTVALSRTASAGFSILMGRDMATSQDFVTWTCGPDLVPEFLLAMLRVMRPYFLGHLAMGSTHKTIYFPDLQDICIPVPDVHSQQIAVEIVAAAAAGRLSGARAMQSQIDLLTEYKTSLVTAAVTGDFDVTSAGKAIPA